MEWITSEFLTGLGVVGTWTLIGCALIFDKGIALKREVTQRDTTIDRLWDIIGEKDHQISNLLHGNRVTVDAFDKVTTAAVSIAEEGRES